MRTLVLGIGNTLLGDEGAGVHAIHELRERNNDLDEVEFMDGGTLSFTLAAPVEDCDNLIVIDAAELQSPPGTVRTFIDEDMDLPRHRALIGIQPQYVDWATQPTPAVAAGIGEACTAAETLLQDWRP
ncbi:MAG: hydrogenase maturation protease [Gammaproteobacteria bacterium]